MSTRMSECFTAIIPTGILSPAMPSPHLALSRSLPCSRPCAASSVALRRLATSASGRRRRIFSPMTQRRCQWVRATRASFPKRARSSTRSRRCEAAPWPSDRCSGVGIKEMTATCRPRAVLGRRGVRPVVQWWKSVRRERSSAGRGGGGRGAAPLDPRYVLPRSCCTYTNFSRAWKGVCVCVCYMCCMIREGCRCHVKESISN